MTVALFFISLLLGAVAALLCGALSGMQIGREALGAELAGYIGGLYGFISGTLAVLLGLLLLAIF